MDLNYNKVFHPIHDVPVIVLTISHFFHDPECMEIIMVGKETEMVALRELIQKHHLLDDRFKFVGGGDWRQDSVSNGLSMVTYEMVLIHDGARPFLTKQMVDHVKQATATHGCALPTTQVTDTIKRIDAEGFVEETFDRSRLCQAQTPQGALTTLIKEAHQLAKEQGIIKTDDVGLIEHFKLSKVKCVEGSPENIKITTSKDIDLATGLFENYFEREA